MKQNSD